MALVFPQPKERRKNRPLDMPPNMPVLTPDNAHLVAALAQIANMTLREMPDNDEYRLWSQEIAHKALVNGSKQ